jgi:hypothetical protein
MKTYYIIIVSALILTFVVYLLSSQKDNFQFNSPVLRPGIPIVLSQSTPMKESLLVDSPDLRPGIPIVLSQSTPMRLANEERVSNRVPITSRNLFSTPSRPIVTLINEEPSPLSPLLLSQDVEERLGSSGLALREAAQEQENADFLLSPLSPRRMDFRTPEMDYTKDTIVTDEMNPVFAQGFYQGFKAAYEEAYKNGEKEGKKFGYASGYADGQSDC